MSAPRRPNSPAALRFFATAAKGLDPIVADELRALGARNVKEARGGASFEGPPAIAYRACLWLRAANRVLYPISKFGVTDDAQLYAGINRIPGVAAPLKENLAAALLLKCGWPEIAKAGGSFVDPLSGSGTLVIEAALMAGDIAPGLLRDYWGFSGWLKHDRRLWEKLIMEARARQTAGRACKLMILGYDHDAKAILTAQQNARTAGVAPMVRFAHKSLEQNILPSGLPPGLVVTNPPYGERLGKVETLGPLYATLGHWLKSQCPGWQAGVIIGDLGLGKQLGIRARKMNSFYNGALECKLLQFSIEPEW